MLDLTVVKNNMSFNFNPATHTYTYKGKKMTGVTTVLRVVSKGDALINWAANMAVEYVKEKSPVVKEGRKNVYQVTNEVLDEARTAHVRKKEARGVEGHDTHAILEEIIKSAIEFSEGYIQRPMFEHPPQISQFIDWAIENKVKFLASEKVMYHPKWFVGGTADFTCKIGDKKYVGDFKTQKAIYDRIPFWQMAAYRAMLQSMGEKGFAGSLILHIPTEGELTPYYSYDYESDLKGFESALQIYRLLYNY